MSTAMEEEMMEQRQQMTDQSTPAAASRTTSLSVFDLDRTLTILPTYTPFLLFAARTRAPWRLLLTPLLLPAALLYAAKLISRRTMKQLMHRLLIGGALPEAEARQLADHFADRLIESGLYADGRALIEAERAAGRRIILATAAPHFYAVAIAQRLGIDDVVATASSWRDGFLRSELGGTNCYGADKLRMLDIFLTGAGIDRAAAHIRFYSDHASDLPVFEFSDEAFAVNPSPKLRGIAAARGWSVLDWDKRNAASPTTAL